MSKQGGDAACGGESGADYRSYVGGERGGLGGGIVAGAGVEDYCESEMGEAMAKFALR